MSLGLSVNVRVGVWLDDLRVSVKDALKVVAPFQPELGGVDAFGVDVNPRALGASGRRDLAHFLRSRGLTLAALRADVGGRRLADPARLDTALGRIREALQLAADIGAPQLVVAGGFVPDEKEESTLAERAALAEGARALAQMGAQGGVRIAWLAGSETPAVLAKFLDGVDSSGVLEVDLNPGGFVMRGVDPQQALQTLAPRVGIARATDQFRGGTEAPFGQGDVRWGEVLVGLSTLQRRDPISVLAGCSIEGDRVAMLSRAVLKLKELRRNPLG